LSENHCAGPLHAKLKSTLPSSVIPRFKIVLAGGYRFSRLKAHHPPWEIPLTPAYAGDTVQAKSANCHCTTWSLLPSFCHHLRDLPGLEKGFVSESLFTAASRQ
jgi:hypothetical protein